MSQKERIEAMVYLGSLINEENEKLSAAVEYASLKNPWFTRTNSWASLQAIKTSFLNLDILEDWLNKYHFSDTEKIVGLILAGNIPLVGFHDLMSVFLSGHSAMIKYSEKDDVIMNYLVEELCLAYPIFKSKFKVVERLENFDAVIATGSNNSSRYFEYYFGKYPNIIRKNRNAVAILDGTETDTELESLSNDVFSYFGLGCRNVSKLYVPREYNFQRMLELFHQNKEIILHTKYKNNFDYNIALFMLNRVEYLNNGNLILKEDKILGSRIACLHYEYYDDIESLEKELQSRIEEIQCISTKLHLTQIDTIPLGKCQSPGIDDYADGIDTMKFLSELV